MNEQQVADLLSEQIDRLLGGEPAADIAGVEDLPELLRLGQQLSELDFQPGPAAQAAFLDQLTHWFGSTNGGAARTGLGALKIWLLSLVVLVAAIGAGLALFGLNPLTSPDEPPPTIARPALSTPAIIEEVVPSAPPRMTETAPPATPTETRSRSTTSLGDTLPTAVPSLGDTLPTPTPTIAPTHENITEDTPGDQSYSPGESTQGDNGDADGNETGDQDRGHGNDADGYDEDNPGNSSGVPTGEDGNNGNSDNAGGQGQENDHGGGSSGGGGGKGQGGGKK
jgi:uncharacterized membrane protein YgcG